MMKNYFLSNIKRGIIFCFSYGLVIYTAYLFLSVFSLSVYGGDVTTQEKTDLTCVLNPTACEKKQSSKETGETEASSLLDCTTCVKGFHQNIRDDKVRTESVKMDNTELRMSKSHLEMLSRNARSHQVVIRRKVAFELWSFFIDQRYPYDGRHEKNKQFEKPAQQLLLILADDPDRRVREFVCKGAMNVSAGSGQERLLYKCAHDPEPAVRSVVVEVPQYRDKLAKDPSPIVRKASARFSFDDKQKPTKQRL